MSAEIMYVRIFTQNIKRLVDGKSNGNVCVEG